MNHIDQRVAILETRVEGVNTDLARLESKIDHITASINKLNESYVAHATEMKVFKWVASLSGGTVLTTLVAKLVMLILA